MVIESACHIAPLKLPDYPDWANRREEEFSRVLASNCEMVLSGLGIPYPHKTVQIEVPYRPGSSDRCDIVVDNSTIPNFPSELSHKEYIECKFFRKNLTGGNTSNLAGSLWQDFRKLLSNGSGFQYSVVLCERNLRSVLPTTGLHKKCVDRCFDVNSPTSFSLWEKYSFDPSKDYPFETNSTPGQDEVRVLRNLTDTFLLKFAEEVRPYRIYIFRLYSQGRSSPGYVF